MKVILTASAFPNPLALSLHPCLLPQLPEQQSVAQCTEMRKTNEVKFPKSEGEV